MGWRVGSPPICGCHSHSTAFLTTLAPPGIFMGKHGLVWPETSPSLHPLASRWPVTPKRWATWGRW